MLIPAQMIHYDNLLADSYLHYFIHKLMLKYQNCRPKEAAGVAATDNVILEICRHSSNNYRKESSGTTLC